MFICAYTKLGTIMKKKVNYLSNAELIVAIQETKQTYCWFSTQKGIDYDVIVVDPFNLTKEEITKGIKTRARRTSTPKDKIQVTDLTLRHMTWEHIPINTDWPETRIKRHEKDSYHKLNFPPFQHYRFKNKIPTIVAKSHYSSLNKFNPTKGMTLETLAKKYMLIVERYSNKQTYKDASNSQLILDDLKGAAILRLFEVGLNFNESKQQYPNPFAYYTQIIKNVFNHGFNKEKLQTTIKSNIYIAEKINDHKACNDTPYV